MKNIFYLLIICVHVVCAKSLFNDREIVHSDEKNILDDMYICCFANDNHAEHYIKTLENDSKAISSDTTVKQLLEFITLTQLVLWKHPEYLDRIISLYQKVIQSDFFQCKYIDKLEKEKVLSLVLFFAAINQHAEKIALLVFSSADYDEQQYFAGITLASWAVLADSSELLHLFIKKGVSTEKAYTNNGIYTPLVAYFAKSPAPNSLGFLMMTHSRLQKNTYGENMAWDESHNFPILTSNLMRYLLCCRERTHGVELATMLIQHGARCIVATDLREYSTSCIYDTVMHDSNNSTVLYQKKWTEIYTYIQEQEKKYREKEGYKKGDKDVYMLLYPVG